MARKKLTTEAFIEKAKEVHGSKYDYSNTVFVASLEKLEVICSQHGSFWQLPYSHLAGHGCADCRKLSLPQFIDKANTIHAGKYNYNKVVITGVHDKVTIT